MMRSLFTRSLVRWATPSLNCQQSTENEQRGDVASLGEEGDGSSERREAVIRAKLGKRWQKSHR